MTACPPLPLAQQVLAWLVQALGYGEAGYPAVDVSPSTLKNARKGARIPHSWEDLVTGALKAMHVPVDTTTLTTLHEALRGWDACVIARVNLCRARPTFSNSPPSTNSSTRHSKSQKHIRPSPTLGLLPSTQTMTLPSLSNTSS